MSNYAISNMELSRSHVFNWTTAQISPLLLISLTSHPMSMNASRWSTLHAVLLFSKHKSLNLAHAGRSQAVLSYFGICAQQLPPLLLLLLSSPL